MAGKLYALLVGIDRYPSSKELHGCVNDANGMAAFLKGRIEQRRLELLTLHNEEATRDRVIERFRNHLGRAGEGDTALFFFGGHGSQEYLPPLYAKSEPDRLSETLVAYDSRQRGGWDLADKELAVLIAEVAARGPHVVIILDSCHAGTATRREGFGERRAPKIKRRRPLGTYWFSDQRYEVPAELDSAGGWRILPAGPHILLACCRDFELSRETEMSDGQVHGVFSYYLVEALQRLRSDLTYRELHQRVQVRVHHHNPNQLPQAEGELDRQLFSGAIVPAPRTYSVRSVPKLGWRLNAGAVHGIQPSSELEVVLGQDGQASRLAKFRVLEVAAGESSLELIDGRLPSSEEVWPAVLTDLPLAPLRVALVGDSTPIEDLRERLERSPFLTTVDRVAAADIVAQAKDDNFSLRRSQTDGAIPTALDGGSRAALEALEHIARWQTTATLENPGSPMDDSIEMVVQEWRGPPDADGVPRTVPAREAGSVIDMAYRNGHPSRFTVRLRNRGFQPLFFALLALDEAFAIKILRGGFGRLAPAHTIWVRPDGIPASVPDALYRRGVTSRRDVLLLLVSEVETDFSLLEQGRLGQPFRSRHRSSRQVRRGALEALMERVSFRELDDETEIVLHHWSVDRRVIVTERP